MLTKPLGTGIIATAIKRGTASAAWSRPPPPRWRTLNRDGAEVAREHGVRAVTDVTGFGLLGHLAEMCRASGVGAEVWFDRLPLLPGVEDLARGGRGAGGHEAQPGVRAARSRSSRRASRTGGGCSRPTPRPRAGSCSRYAKERAAQVVRALGEKGVPAAAVIGMIREEERTYVAGVAERRRRRLAQIVRRLSIEVHR